MSDIRHRIGFGFPASTDIDGSEVVQVFAILDQRGKQILDQNNNYLINQNG